LPFTALRVCRERQVGSPWVKTSRIFSYVKNAGEAGPAFLPLLRDRVAGLHRQVCCPVGIPGKHSHGRQDGCVGGGGRRVANPFLYSIQFTFKKTCRAGLKKTGIRARNLVLNSCADFWAQWAARFVGKYFKHESVMQTANASVTFILFACSDIACRLSMHWFAFLGCLFLRAGCFRRPPAPLGQSQLSLLSGVALPGCLGLLCCLPG
jgi:hypothetical protein